MRHIRTVIAILALLTAVHAEEFTLTDETGKKYGPFKCEQGEKLSIGGQEYTINKALTKEQKITDKMKAIVIPQIDFRSANIHDVIKFLQDASVEFDQKSEYSQRGVNVVLNLGPPSESDSQLNYSVALGTWSAHDVSMYETLNIICKLCNLTWSIQDSVVMIEPVEKEKVQQTPGTRP